MKVLSAGTNPQYKGRGKNLQTIVVNTTSGDIKVGCPIELVGATTPRVFARQRLLQLVSPFLGILACSLN